MRHQWLNILLDLSNTIYRRKQDILVRHGFRAVADVFMLILVELALALVSLPLYLGLKPSTTAAYLRSRGVYGDITGDYKLRKIITLTGVGVVLLIWIIKLCVIIFVPRVYGPLPLYNVSGSTPVGTESAVSVIPDRSIQQAKVDLGMPLPVITHIAQTNGRDFRFSGTAQPSSTIVLLLADQQVVSYYGEANEKGEWQIDHLQEKFNLSDGNHAVSVLSYNPKTLLRSHFSDQQFFKVTSTWIDILIRNIDTIANWGIILILAFGILLTILTF